jgi:MFS transporter, FHS family, Na+ dependent glucose transporter 1
LTQTTLPQANPSMSRERLYKTAAYYLTFVALGLAGVTLGPTLAALAGHTNTHLDQISFLFSARAVGYMTGSFISGRIYDRMPGHPVIIAMLMATAGALFLVPMVPVLWLLVAVLIVLGAAEGAIDVGGNTLLVWTHGRQVGPFMNGLHFCWGLGAFLSPIVIAQAVLISGDIDLAYWAIAILVLPPIIGLLRLPSPIARKESSGAQAAAVNLRLLLPIIAFFFLIVGAEGTFGGWIFTYAVAFSQIDQTTAAYLTSTFWGALTVGRFLAIPIAARVKLDQMLLADVVGCLASVGLILVLPQWAASVWIGTFGMGLFMASMFPTMISYAEQRMHITGKTTAWFLVGSSGGGMTIPWLIGQLFERMGPRITMVIAFVDLAFALAVFLLVLTSAARITAPTAQPEIGIDIP